MNSAADELIALDDGDVNSATPSFVTAFTLNRYVDPENVENWADEVPGE